jgi:aryl carrier-like protein
VFTSMIGHVDADESVVPPAWVDQVFDGFVRQLVTLSGSTADPTRSEGERSLAESLTNPNSEAERLERVRSDVEEVFGELLGDTRLEHHRTWFDQGATSVTLVSAQRRLQERGHVIDIVDLFARPTPADTIALLVAPTLDPAPAQVSGAAAETPGSSRVSPREGHHRSAALAAASRRGRRRRAVR